MTLRSHSLQHANAPSARRVAPWRFWTTIVTIAAFLSLLLAASSHHHISQAEDQDCAICSVVSHKVSDPPPVVLPQLVLVLLNIAPFLAFAACKPHLSPSLLPPACGPPSRL
ncbi:MAG TPA: hypothetical protein VF798_02830 [Burkholderiaceae bacterium]